MHDDCLRLPIDSRLYVISLYVAALALLIIDTLDGHLSILAAWAIFAAMVATGWSMLLALTYSRRIVLEVMSFEHRQMTPAFDREAVSIR